MRPEDEARQSYQTFPRTEAEVMRHRSLSTELLGDGKPRGGQTYYGVVPSEPPWSLNGRDSVLRHMGPHERFSADFVWDICVDPHRLLRRATWATITKEGLYVWSIRAELVGSIMRLEGETITRIYRFTEYDDVSEMYLASWVD